MNKNNTINLSQKNENSTDLNEIKIDNLVQSSLSSSLMLTLIWGSIHWSTLRSLSHNT